MSTPIDSPRIGAGLWQSDVAATGVADSPADQVRTLAIQPEYLKTHGHDGIINYSEWSVPLGRRFRALKLWFLLRYHGLEGLRTMIRNHVTWSEELAKRLAAGAISTSRSAATPSATRRAAALDAT